MQSFSVPWFLKKDRINFSIIIQENFYKEIILGEDLGFILFYERAIFQQGRTPFLI